MPVTFVLITYSVEDSQPREHSSIEHLDLLRYHLDLHDQYSKELEPRPFKALHRFFKIYVKGFRGAGELRNQLMGTATTDEVRALLNEAAGHLEATGG